MSAKNTELVGIISEANVENFDYKNLGETKCKEIADGVKGLEKTVYDTEFFNMIQKIPKNAIIEEIIGTTLEQLDSVTEKFNKSGIADKRRTLSALGSSLILTDKKLSLEEHFWLQPIKKNKAQIIDEIEKVQTLPQQMKNASEEAIYQSWLGMRDSNPRMLGPEPSALPLGESPTPPYFITFNARKKPPPVKLPQLTTIFKIYKIKSSQNKLKYQFFKY